MFGIQEVPSSRLSGLGGILSVYLARKHSFHRKCSELLALPMRVVIHNVTPTLLCALGKLVHVFWNFVSKAKN